MTQEEIIAAIERYEQGKASAPEAGLLESWYNQYAGERTADDHPEDLWLRKENSLKIILRRAIPDLQRPARRFRLGMIGSAAALLSVLLGLAFWFYQYSLHPDVKNDNVQVSDVKNKILLSKSPTITLSNGKVIQLNIAKAGIVITGDKLTYSDGSLVPGTELRVQENEGVNLQRDELIVSVPRGAQYNLQLADGSKIWLNADSRLKIVASFNSSFERMVGLVGEAYFEVAKSEMQWHGKKRKRPFYVIGKRHNVSVLGTCFNVTSYPAEPIQVTLLEGSVEVNSSIIKPGEQATVSRWGNVKVNAVPVEDAISWRAGYFRFKNEPMENVMNKISRWYDLEVRYEDESLKYERLSGMIIRYDSIDEVLNKLQKGADFKFEIKGKVIGVKRRT